MVEPVKRFHEDHDDAVNITAVFLQMLQNVSNEADQVVHSIVAWTEAVLPRFKLIANIFSEPFDDHSFRDFRENRYL